MLKCNFNKVASNFIEIALQHGCSPVNLLHIFRTPFIKTLLGGCFCFSNVPLTLSYIMLKNGQTYFKNFAVQLLSFMNARINPIQDGKQEVKS